MDAMLKNLSILDAKTLIYKLIDDSNIDTIGNFWLIELGNLHLGKNDSETTNRLLTLKNEDSEISKAIYNKCIKTNIISKLLKRNWRRLFNNNVIEKYNDYKSNLYTNNISINKGDEVWVMS